MKDHDAQSDQATRLRRLMESIVAGDTPVAGSGDAQSLRSPVAACGVHVCEPDADIAPSTPSGAVSFRPRPVAAGSPPPAPVAHRPRAVRSAAPSERLLTPAPHRAPAPPPPTHAPAPRLARAIAVTSGKGGVGKSNIAVNLAVTLAASGRKVCLLDADFGLANVDVLCNMRPKLTLQHVVTGRCQLADAMMLGPGGFRLIPGASGVAGMADIGARHRAILLDQLGALERVADIIIIDCAAGISSNVLAFAAAAHTTLVATTPEPPAISDAYGMIKSLWRRSPDARIKLVVNMVSDGGQAAEIHRRMDAVARSFLKRSVGFAGAIPLDPLVPSAVYHRLPFTLFAPDGRATRSVHAIAMRLLEGDRHQDETRGGFFARLASFLGGGRSDRGRGRQGHNS